jgi:hypothetical protein
MTIARMLRIAAIVAGAAVTLGYAAAGPTTAAQTHTAADAPRFGVDPAWPRIPK